MAVTALKSFKLGRVARARGAVITGFQAKVERFLVKARFVSAVGAPVVTLGTATSTTQPLTWTEPSGSPTDYKVEYKAAASQTWLTFADSVSATTSATVTGLTAATSYNYRVSAIKPGSENGVPSAIVTGSTAA